MSESVQTDFLLDRARGGDSSARQQLMELYRSHLKRMVAVRLDRRTAARIDPSDVVQETLLEASKRLDGYLGNTPLPFLAWLRQIAAERVIDAHRRHVGSKRRSVTRERGEVELPDASGLALARHLVESQTSPSGHLMRKERLDRVRHALDTLSERDREVLVMRHLEHLGIEEIAGVLGLTAGAVKARILRALLRLKSVLETPP
ncbi:MAG: sigma-70 family RNA polymerase sigma factor [Isosphaeraceae bacterium]